MHYNCLQMFGNGFTQDSKKNKTFTAGCEMKNGKPFTKLVTLFAGHVHILHLLCNHRGSVEIGREGPLQIGVG